MFNHIVIGSNDIERSRQFYNAVLGLSALAIGFVVGKKIRH